MNLKANLTVRITRRFKALYYTVMTLERIKILSSDVAAWILNEALQRGAIKYKINSGRWKSLSNIDYVFVAEKK